MTLTEFLLARVAEDERDVRDVQSGKVFDLADMLPIGCWGFERVLAECEAKRRIVERYRRTAEEEGWHTAAMDTLLDLALPYADHPDYDEEWRP